MFLLGLVVGVATGAALVGFPVFLGYRMAQIHAAKEAP